jgi:transposase
VHGEIDLRFVDPPSTRHELVSDKTRAVIEQLLPGLPAKLEVGLRRVPDRGALRGIVFVLRSGLPWEFLPHEVFGCSGVTRWRRLRDWRQADLWNRLHRRCSSAYTARASWNGAGPRSTASPKLPKVGRRDGVEPDWQGLAGH